VSDFIDKVISDTAEDQNQALKPHTLSNCFRKSLGHLQKFLKYLEMV